MFEILPWDSAFFGFATARILPSVVELPDLEEALARLSGQGARLAYWSVDPDHAASAEAALACRGYPADLKLTYALDLSGPSTRAGSAWTIRPAPEGASWEPLRSLALRAGMHSRFRVDPRFPPALFQALYEEWLRKSLSGEMADAVLTAEDENGPAGFITVSARDGEGSIGLVAVEERVEGRGLGTALMRAAEEWFLSRRCARARVVTQGANRAACALYGKNGYRVAKRERIYHFWLD